MATRGIYEEGPSTENKDLEEVPSTVYQVPRDLPQNQTQPLPQKVNGTSQTHEAEYGINASDIDELLDTVMKVFSKYRGIAPPAVETTDSPYERCRIAVREVLTEGLCKCVTQNVVDHRICGPSDFLKSIRHPVCGIKEKKGKKVATNVYDCSDENGCYVNDNGHSTRPRKRRSKDFEGRRERGECFECGSKDHLARHCPQRARGQQRQSMVKGINSALAEGN